MALDLPRKRASPCEAAAALVLIHRRARRLGRRLGLSGQIRGDQLMQTVARIAHPPVPQEARGVGGRIKSKHARKPGGESTAKLSWPDTMYFEGPLGWRRGFGFERQPRGTPRSGLTQGQGPHWSRSPSGVLA